MAFGLKGLLVLKIYFLVLDHQHFSGLLNSVMLKYYVTQISLMHCECFYRFCQFANVKCLFVLRHLHCIFSEKVRYSFFLMCVMLYYLGSSALMVTLCCPAANSLFPPCFLLIDWSRTLNTSTKRRLISSPMATGIQQTSDWFRGGERWLISTRTRRSSAEWWRLRTPLVLRCRKRRRITWKWSDSTTWWSPAVRFSSGKVKDISVFR